MLIVLLQVKIYDMYVVVLLKTMWRRLMEIMLMAKLMEIVSSIVVYVCIYIYIYIHTICQPLIDWVLGVLKKIESRFFFFFFGINSS